MDLRNIMMSSFFSKVAEELISGGKADKHPDWRYDLRELKKGIEVEMEHTNDREKAKEIAKDHLEEFPAYYTYLAEMEAEFERHKRNAREEEEEEEEEEDYKLAKKAKVQSDIYNKFPALKRRKLASKKDMPHFTSQDRPQKVKDIYRALKREHPKMPAEMKARIAARQGKPGKQKQGPPYKGPLAK